MRRLAYPLFGLWAALAVAAVVLQAQAGEQFEALSTFALGVLAGVGALLWRRRPENVIGPILLCLALVVTASVVGDGISVRYEDDADPGLGVRLVVWIDEALLYVWFGLVGVLLPLLFPDGRLPSPRWRPVLWAGLALVALAVFGTVFGVEQGDWDETGTIRNPLAVGGPVGDALEAGAGVSAPLFGIVVLLALASVVVRFRRARGVERQQLKWFGWAIGLLLAGLAAAAIGEATGYEPIGNVGWTVFLTSLIGLVPLAIAVAILRYRLYDIDLVIRRTLVYGALTLTLGAAYLGSVLLVSLAVGESGLATAVSTLAVAALFRPARSRIQGAVDQRFYRRRYDAARTLEAFGLRLRDELDLEALAADVRGVVQRHRPARARVAVAEERAMRRLPPGACSPSTVRSPRRPSGSWPSRARTPTRSVRVAVRRLRGRRHADRAPAAGQRGRVAAARDRDLLRRGRGGRGLRRRTPRTPGRCGWRGSARSRRTSGSRSR